jgi:hypothetical protein
MAAVQGENDRRDLGQRPGQERSAVKGHEPPPRLRLTSQLILAYQFGDKGILMP